jgi:hypothetical protein
MDHFGPNIAQDVITALAGQMGVEDMIVGLHNAFAHGAIFELSDEEVTDKQLEDCFDHIDGLLAAVKERD